MINNDKTNKNGEGSKSVCPWTGQGYGLMCAVYPNCVTPTCMGLTKCNKGDCPSSSVGLKCIQIMPFKKFKVCDAAAVGNGVGSNVVVGVSVGAAVGAAVCGAAVSVMAYMRVLSARRDHLTSPQGKLLDLPVCADVPVWADVVQLSSGFSGVSWSSGVAVSVESARRSGSV
jgi:hypothetical protein